MILSEFAGAAQSLNGSIVVNPWDSQQVADAIHEAVTMDSEKRAENQKKLFKVRSLFSALGFNDHSNGVATPFFSTSKTSQRHSGAHRS